MKQTVNVNIGSVAFTMDEDAFRLLQKYLDDIESRLDSSDLDSMEDIENRVAGLFSDRISSSIQVVNIDMVRRAIALIGKPETFGDKKREPEYYDNSSYDSRFRNKRLYRSTNSKMIGGVCGGIAEYFDLDASLIRLAAILLLFLGGMSLLVYVLLWIVIPRRPNYVK